MIKWSGPILWDGYIYSERVACRCLERGYVLGRRWILGVSHIVVNMGAYSGGMGRFWEGRISEWGGIL